jgi:hypothetical protein
MNGEYIRLIGQELSFYNLGYVDIKTTIAEDHLFLNTNCF